MHFISYDSLACACEWWMPQMASVASLLRQISEDRRSGRLSAEVAANIKNELIGGTLEKDEAAKRRAQALLELPPADMQSNLMLRRSSSSGRGRRNSISTSRRRTWKRPWQMGCNDQLVTDFDKTPDMQPYLNLCRK